MSGLHDPLSDQGAAIAKRYYDRRKHGEASHYPTCIIADAVVTGARIIAHEIAALRLVLLSQKDGET